MIRGHVNERRVFVEGTLIVPRLRRYARRQFMLDTGSPYSIIFPGDFEALGIEMTGAFGGRQSTQVRGIGGWTDFFIDEADHLFRAR